MPTRSDAAARQADAESRSHRRGHGEGTIFRRKDGRWAAVADLGWQGGRRARKWLYGTSRAEVARKLTKTLRDLQQGIAPANEQVTVSTWLTHYLDDLEARRAVRHATLTRYRGILRTVVAPTLGHLRLGHVQPQHIQSYQSELLRAGFSVSTVILHRALLSGALKEAVSFGLIPRNVVGLVKPPKQNDDQPAGKALTADHARALLEAAHDDLLLAVYCLLLLTAGLRRGEALGLSWRDVELPPDNDPDLVHRALVHVRHQLQWPSGVPTIVPVKSRKGVRDVPMPSMAARALYARRALQRVEFAARGQLWCASELVLTTPEGKPVHPNSITKQFHANLKAAGLPHYRPHDLRHTYGSLLMSQGVPLKTISDLMGHASINVTADVYLHSQAARLLDTADAMARALDLPSTDTVLA